MKLTNTSLDYIECVGCNKAAYPHNRFTVFIYDAMYGMIDQLYHFCSDCSNPDIVLPKMQISSLTLDNDDIARYVNYINRLYKDYR